jgi:hypothetical protein
MNLNSSAMAAWGENVDVLTAIANVGGNSPLDQFQRANMLAKMRKAFPIILHSKIAITPEENAAKLITGMQTEDGTPMRCNVLKVTAWWNHSKSRMSDLSYAAGGLTAKEYKVLDAKMKACQIAGITNGCCSSDKQVSMDDTWERAMVIIKDLGGWEEIQKRKERQKERQMKAEAKAAFKRREQWLCHEISRIKKKRAQLNEKAAALRREADDAEARAHRMIEVESRKNEELEKLKQEQMAPPKYKRPKRIA